MNNIKSLQQFLSGHDRGLDRAMANGKVQLMRLKNIAITIDGKQHKDKNLFDLFLDHQNDNLFDDYVREHTPVNAKLLMQTDYVVVFVADGKYSRFAGVYQVFGEDFKNKDKIFVKVRVLDVFRQFGGRVLVDWGGMAAQRWLQWFKNDKNIIRSDDGVIRTVIPFKT